MIKSSKVSLKLVFAILALALLLGPIPSIADETAESTNTEFSSSDPRAYDYANMLELTRAFLTGPRGERIQKNFFRKVFAKELKVSDEMQKLYDLPEKFKDLSVQQFMILLRENPDKWEMLQEILNDIPSILDPTDLKAIQRSEKAFEEFHKLVESGNVRAQFNMFNDPSIPFLLKNQDGSPGFSSLQFFATHKRIGLNGRHYKENDLIKALQRLFNRKYVKQISGNTYEFSTPELAETLISLHKQGKEVHWGVHWDIHSEAGLEVVDMFRVAGFVIVDQKKESELSDEEIRQLKLDREGKNSFTLVHSVGLNHHKIVSINWSDPKTARAIFSSGNFTDSGIHPLGDLARTGHKDPDTKSNANHFVTMRSHSLALVARHQMEMIFDLGLRGKELPFSGAFAVEGKPNKDGSIPYITLAFAPSGGFGDISKNLIGRAIKEARGPISMTQFTYSSQTIDDALFEYAMEEKKYGREFVYLGIGDRSPMMRDWSKFLSISGIKQVKEEDGTKYYVEDVESRWVKSFTPEEMQAIRDRVRVAPPNYPFIRFVKLPDGTEKETSAKIHHKNGVFGGARIISDEEARSVRHYRGRDGLNYVPDERGFAILGNSFNFGEAAQSSNEHFVGFKNVPQANAFGWSIFFGLDVDSPRSTFDEAIRRNRRNPATKDKIVCNKSFK